MLKELLEILSQNQVAINGSVEENEWELINTIIFWKKFRWDVMAYKKKFFRKLRLKEKNILILQERAYKEELSVVDKSILLSEIHASLIKIQFLREKFDIEAQKIDENIDVFENSNMDFYNKSLFWVTKKDIWEKISIDNCPIYVNTYTKKDLELLIQFSNTIFPDLRFEFWNFSNLSHSWWVIKIPRRKFYSIKTIITIFFHETTHFFRSYNGERNLGFKYRFSDYYTLEEGIAIYNEHKYGNRIINLWKFTPYYNACFQVLMQNIDENEKISKIYEILKCKGFSEEQSLKYYYRFNKYNVFWERNFYLKDLVYQKWYKNVTKLLHLNTLNYQKIMAWDIWIDEVSHWLVSADNNYNVSLYFNSMVKKIKAIL